MGRIKIDLVGKRFGRYVVLKEMLKRNKFSKIQWHCRCDCGVEKIVTGENLKSGSTLSCGCYNRDATKEANYKHGCNRRGSTTREYTVWTQMLGRCYNKKNSRYKNYGARGIIVCDRWKYSFNNFISDIGERPSEKHSIERDEVNGNYEPSNCRWATDLEQARNRTDNHWIEHDGRKMILQDWVNELNAGHANLLRMLKTKSFSEVYDYYKYHKRKSPVSKIKVNG